MKELSIEEKAKAYDEALKEAVIAHKDEDRHLKATLERIFPALKESRDEWIRKWLIEMVEVVRKANPTNADNNGMCSEAKAWLERQGEKPVYSEEDEKMIRALMSICDEWATRHSYLPKENNDIEKIKNWLQSLKVSNNITDEKLDWSAAIRYLKKRT